jgi:hypothetical protein
VLGVLAWLFTRRRTPRAEPRRIYDTEALAAGIPTTDDVVAPRAAEKRAAPEPAPTFSEPAPRAKPSTPHWTSAPATLGNAPTWHGGASQADGETALAEPQTAKQQLELARAYLDMGDDDAARGDPARSARRSRSGRARYRRAHVARAVMRATLR